MTILGIDLGTSNSLVSIWQNESIQLIPNVFGEFLTPSVVGIDDYGEVLVGKIAKERMITHPEKVAAAFKRMMGTKKEYTLDAVYSFTPVELSALLLKSLKRDAEEYLGHPCVDAVISVPAYFNNLQRKDTILAADLAGLNCINLISEPTAAALAYERESETPQTVMIVDLGGGTYDVSLLDIFEGIVQVNGIAGDNRLGGEDFTTALIMDFLKKESLKISDLSAIDKATLQKKMEALKVSTPFPSQINLTIADTDYIYKVTTKELEKIWAPFLEQLNQPINRVLNDTETKIENIDKVILIGGGSKLSFVRQNIGRMMKQLPFTKINPDRTVCFGTAIQGALKMKEEMVQEKILTDVCSFTMGIDVVMEIDGILQSGFFSPIIERNSSLPISKMAEYTTTVNDQKEILIEVYQGENMFVDENIKIGQLVISVPKAEAGQLIQVRFTYDTNGILEVEAFIPEINQMERLYIKGHHSDVTEEEMEQSFAKLQSLKTHPRDIAEYRLLLARVDRLYAELSGNIRLFLMKLHVDFEAALNTQDEEFIREKAVSINKVLDALERDMAK